MNNMDHRGACSPRHPHILLKIPSTSDLITKCIHKINKKSLVANKDVISQISGNVPDDVKRFCVGVLRYFVSEKGLSWGAEVGSNLVLSEVNIRECASSVGRTVEGSAGNNKVGSHLMAETVVEITCSQEMCNVLGTLHGACAAYVVDLCSVSSLVVLGAIQGFDGTGVSQAMNLIWHHPIRLGQKIRVVSTAHSGQSKIRTMKSELWANGRLCISSVHSTISVSHSQSCPFSRTRHQYLSNNNLDTVKTKVIPKL